MGSCTAGAAYVPAMSDETIIVNKTGTVFLGGPPLVKAATGEEVTAEELGGATVHCERSGVTDYFCKDDDHALQTVRNIVKNIDHEDHRRYLRNRNLVRPSPCLELDTIQLNSGSDFRHFLRLIFEDFQEFKERFDGEALISGYGKIGKQIPVGVIAATSPSGLTFNALSKAAHLVQLCEKRGYPMIFFNKGNFSAHSPSPEFVKAGARLASAIACCKVPKITLNIGPVIGWTSVFFGSRSFDPTFLFSWPNSYVSMEYDKELENQPVPALSAAAKLYDDGIIEPRDTPVVLFDALSISLENTTPSTGVDPIAVHFNTTTSSLNSTFFRM